MNQTVNEISFKCNRGILENIDNLDGENIYRKLDINIILDNKALKRIYLPGNVIIKRVGIPSLTFQGCSLLKDNCCSVISPGFYVNLLYLFINTTFWILFIHNYIVHLGPIHLTTEEFPGHQSV